MMRGRKGWEKQIAEVVSGLHYVQSLCWALGQPRARIFYPVPLRCFFQPAPLNRVQLLLLCPMVFAPSKDNRDLCHLCGAGIAGCAMSSRRLSNTNFWKQQRISTSLGQVLVRSKILLLSWANAVVPTDREILQHLCSFVVLLPDP